MHQIDNVRVVHLKHPCRQTYTHQKRVAELDSEISFEISTITLKLIFVIVSDIMVESGHIRN